MADGEVMLDGDNGGWAVRVDVGIGEGGAEISAFVEVVCLNGVVNLGGRMREIFVFRATWMGGGERVDARRLRGGVANCEEGK